MSNEENRESKKQEKEKKDQSQKSTENDKGTSAEAYNYVEHALSLLDSGYYDDAIEALKSAKELYSQISREEEISMVKQKISDIYLMKEEALGEEQAATESEGEKEKKDLSEEKEFEEKKEKESKEQQKVEYSRKDKEIILNEAYEFLDRGEKLANTEYFEDAIKNFRKAKNLFKKIGKRTEETNVEDKINAILAEKEEKLEKKEEKQKLEEEKKKHAEKQLKARMKKAKQQEVKKKEERFKKIQEYETKKIEEKRFRKEIDRLIDKAEKLAREYEVQIRKGNFKQECIYPQIINIYTEVRKKLFKRGWDKEASMYTNQIKKYKDKLEKDKKLRELEEEKKQKDKKFEEYYKSRGKPSKKTEAKAIKEKKQDKRLSDKRFEEKISNMVDKAENLAGAYERNIRRGKFEEQCVYPQVIDIYKEVRKRLFEQGWDKEAQIYTNQIKIYKEKLEKDKKLRKLEEEKKKKDKKYEKYFKSKKGKKEKKAAKQKGTKKTSENERGDKAFDLINKAENAVKNYELKLKKNILLHDPPYEEAIELYRKAQDIFKEIGWKEEATRLNDTINHYKQKQAKDEKLREKERKGLKKEQKKELEEGKKDKKAQKEKSEKEEIPEKILNSINEAEKIAKEYEKQIKRNKAILQIECPYEKVIRIYRTAKKRFNKLGWDEEAQKLIRSINFYKKKLQKDKKLREFERQKKQKEKRFEERLKAIKKPDGIAQELKREKLKDDKKEGKVKADEIFEKINKSERKGKKYEREIKGGQILDHKSPYEDIIQTYRRARKELKDIGWNEEAQKLLSSINYYKKKFQQDQKLREFERKKENRKKEFEKMARTKPKSPNLEKRKERLAKEQKKTRESDIQREKAFKLMDKGKLEFKKNNFDKAIRHYKESEEIFEEIGWEKGKTMINQSIAVIKRKRKALSQKQQKLKEKEKEKKELEKKLEERIAGLREKNEIERKQKRDKFVQDQKEKKEESALTEKAYGLLEQGTKLAQKKKFDEALEKYKNAREIFSNLGWSHEISRINNELLYKLKKKVREAKKREDFKKKQEEKEKALKTLLDKAEKKRKKKKEQTKKEKRERLHRLSGGERKKEKLLRKSNQAEDLIEQGQVNEAILLLKNIQKISKKTELIAEFPDISKKVSKLKENTNIPIITDSAEEADLKDDNFQSAYRALDKANQAIEEGHLMKAVSELNEAKFNLQSLPGQANSLSLVEEKIEEWKDQLRSGKSLQKTKKESAQSNKKDLEPTSDLAYEYMDKSNKEKRKNNYKKAIELANKALEVFETLGAEWAREKAMVNKHIVQLEQSQEKRQELFTSARKEQEEKARGQKKQKKD
ncbi:MAG: hypothetical protein R6U96_15030 [Promethearchaeia archaeon]